MIRIENIRLRLDDPVQLRLKAEAAKILKIPIDEIQTMHIVKKSVDARKKQQQIYLIYSVDVQMKEEKRVVNLQKTSRSAYRIKHVKIDKYRFPETDPVNSRNRVVIVGTGPCGLFAGLVLAHAGLKPLLIERGEKVEKRKEDVTCFFKSGDLTVQSNVQFGEGGAGTFSDGKLYTLIHDSRTKFIFDRLVEAGAPREILYEAKPHIGTDKLIHVVRNLRKQIIKWGGEFQFETQMTLIRSSHGRLRTILVNGVRRLSVDALILAIGHSARDTFEMLLHQGMVIEPKSFSIGLRIEHKKEWIEEAQYGRWAGHPELPSATYKLSTHLSNGRCVYTFCMCPGGVVVSAASEPKGVVTNGMSLYHRNHENSNSGVMVNVSSDDYGSNHPLAGVYFQQQWEQKAYDLGGRKFYGPVQLVGDFLKDRVSYRFQDILPSYRPGTCFADLRKSLPDFVIRGIKTGIHSFKRQISCFDHPAGILTGVETRSSSPIRLIRGEDLQSNIEGIFPAGEGAGYAGGIVSAAVDGMRVAEGVVRWLNNRSNSVGISSIHE